MSLSSTSRTVLPGARPVRLATRKMWVSTAMVGCAERRIQHHIGGLAADPGQLPRAPRGVLRHLAAMLRRAAPWQVAMMFLALLLYSPIDLTYGVMPLTPRASIAGRRVCHAEQIRGGLVDALVGGLGR